MGGKRGNGFGKREVWLDLGRAADGCVPERGCGSGVMVSLCWVDG